MKYALSMARTYTQDARADAAAAKRLQVLDTAIDMLASEPLPRVTLEAVARRAGAARSTVYVMFGSRAGLFDAVARRLLERIGFDRLVAAVAAPDPLEALRQAMHESVRLYAEQRDAARALWSWADLDTDAAGAFAVLDGGRASGTAHLVGRLAAAGRLRPGVGPDEAADVLYVLTSFDTFDQLFTERQLTPDTVERRLQLLLGSIVSV
jgi:AcrR family transcriptional regulator